MMHGKVGSITGSFPPVASTPVSRSSTRRATSEGAEPAAQIEIPVRTLSETVHLVSLSSGDQKDQQVQIQQVQGQHEQEGQPEQEQANQERAHQELDLLHQDQFHSDQLVGVSADARGIKQASATDMLSATPQSSIPSTPIDSIITPPYSSTLNESPPLFENNPPNIRKKRSFGARRRGVPSALDIDALNRERQFSGPFSANPLLRSHGDKDINDGVPVANMAKPTEAGKELTPKEPAAVHCAVQTPPKPVTLPLISDLMTGAFLSPSRSTAPVSVVSPLVCTPAPWASEKSKLGREQPPTYSSPKRPRLDSDWMVKNARKEQFLKLCSEAWDLLRGDDI